MQTASFVLGILSLSLSLSSFAFLGYIPLTCGILSLVFGAISKKKDHPKQKKAKTGFILGLIGVILTVILSISSLFIHFHNNHSYNYDNYADDYYDYNYDYDYNDYQDNWWEY